MVQSMIGQSSLAAQNRIDSGEEKVVGVNCYQHDDETPPPPMRPDPETMRAHVDAFVEYKAGRAQADVDRAVSALRRAAQSEDENIFARVVDAAEVGATHGEIVSALREELGFGEPLVIA